MYAEEGDVTNERQRTFHTQRQRKCVHGNAHVNKRKYMDRTRFLDVFVLFFFYDKCIYMVRNTHSPLFCLVGNTMVLGLIGNCKKEEKKRLTEKVGICWGSVVSCNDDVRHIICATWLDRTEPVQKARQPTNIVFRKSVKTIAPLSLIFFFLSLRLT